MLVLVNGDYVPQGNGLQSAKGDEAVLQRMLMKLTARRGQFPFMENFGSRLWTLDRLRPADRQAAAVAHAAVALDFNKTLDIKSDFSSEITLYSLSSVNYVTDLSNLIISQIPYSCIRINPCLCKDPVRACTANTIYISKTDFYTFFSR